jgi:hypothetical protein
MKSDASAHTPRTPELSLTDKIPSTSPGWSGFGPALPFKTLGSQKFRLYLASGRDRVEGKSRSNKTSCKDMHSYKEHILI